MQKSKMAVWGGLTNICEKKRSEKQRGKGKIYPFECKVLKSLKRDKKAFLVPDLPVAPQDEAGLTKTFQTWPRGWFHIP